MIECDESRGSRYDDFILTVKSQMRVNVQVKMRYRCKKSRCVAELTLVAMRLSSSGGIAGPNAWEC
jgi:hypothetical protein